MTNRSKKALEAVLADDDKTLAINTRNVSPLSGLELTNIENKQKNIVTSSNNWINVQNSSSPYPLSGTINSQTPQKSLLYDTPPLLHNDVNEHASNPLKSSQLSKMGSSNCYTRLYSYEPTR